MQDDDQKPGIISLLVVCSASFLSTLYIIIFYFLNRKQIRSFSFDLVIMLCISDFFYSCIGLSRSIWMLIDPDTSLSKTACYIQGILVQTFTISSFICTTSISYSLYQSVVKMQPIYRRSAFKLFWKNNYLYPFLSGLSICCFQYYGPIKPFSNTLCYISGDNDLQVQLMMLFYYYIPYFFSLIFDSVLIFWIIKYYRSLQNEYQVVRFNQIIKLACYPLILFLCWLPVITFRILKFFGIQSETYIEIGHISDNLIGCLNSLFYVIISLDPFGWFKNSSTDSFQSDISQSILKNFSEKLDNKQSNCDMYQQKSESSEGSKIYLKQSNTIRDFIGMSSSNSE
ncbi:hypothetical protein ABPG72_008478 [Tetrahymena utriculariae]